MVREQLEKLDEKHVRSTVSLASRSVDRLLGDLCAAAYPHPVQSYPAYVHFDPVMSEIVELWENCENDSNGLIPFDIVQNSGVTIIESMNEYLEKYKDDDYEGKSAAYEDIERTMGLVNRLLEGVSLKTLVKEVKAEKEIQAKVEE